MAGVELRGGEGLLSELVIKTTDPTTGSLMASYVLDWCTAVRTEMALLGKDSEGNSTYSLHPPIPEALGPQLQHYLIIRGAIGGRRSTGSAQRPMQTVVLPDTITDTQPAQPEAIRTPGVDLDELINNGDPFGLEGSSW